MILAALDSRTATMKIPGSRFSAATNSTRTSAWRPPGSILARCPWRARAVAHRLQWMGFGLAVVGMPLNERFGVFGKVGLYMWDVSGGGLATGISDDGSDIMFGAGVNWNLTDRFGCRPSGSASTSTEMT